MNSIECSREAVGREREEREREECGGGVECDF